MFRALMGGGRSSDSRSTTSSSKSSSRRRTNSKASSTVSRKSSRGDDRDRGLGDLSAYSSSGSRSKRYAPSAAGDSVASSYATAEPGISVEHDRIIVERTPKRRDTDEESGRDRYSDIRDRDGRSSRRRDRDRSQSRERERPRSERNERAQLEDDAVEPRDRRRERSRTQSGDTYLPPVSTSMPIQPNSPMVYDPHVQQQFPGQFPTYIAEPYRPPNPAGEAADYYGDQGQSVAEQPGVRPKPPSIIPNSQAHLMAASPVANPPPEPSSMGQVGAAAAYFADDADLEVDPAPGRPDRPTAGATSKPPKPSNATFGIPGMAAGAAAYGAGSSFPLPASPTSPPEPVPTAAPYAPPVTSSTSKPPHSNGVGASVGAAAAGAAAGYMLGHHQHHSMSSTDHLSQYTMQNYDESSQHGFGNPGPTIQNAPANPAWYAAGTGAALPYAASPLHPHHAAVHHGAPFPSGSLAFQQRQRGPLDKFIDFWRDPEGVGMFEDYTEAIGVCKYCFEPGTSSRDAPRRHHYRPRRSSGERYSGGSRVGKASRYTSSEDESRRRKKSSRSSWLLPGLLGGIATKALFNNKDFEDTYSVRSGRAMAVNDTESVSTTRRSQTSRGVYRRRSQSRDRESRIIYSDSKKSQYGGGRHRSRSRSRSSSRNDRHSALRDAALGAAVGSGASALAKSRHRSRSRSPSRFPRKAKGRKSSTSDSSSFLDISQPPRKSVGGGIASFFTASSENRSKRRLKKRRSIFSFNNSSSSSLDADLAFGTGFARKPAGKSNKKSSKRKDRDVDAALLGLGAAATALAATSHRRSRRTGEILAAKETRSRHSDYASSATNDEGWEDLDSGDQSSSSVSSALAFGDSGMFGSDESQSSDSGTSKWGWRWGSKKDKKKRRASSPQHRFPTGAALAAGALGTAALASTQNRDSKISRQAASSSSGSLQHVAPVPTSDPTLVDAIKVTSLSSAEPALVRPGPIPLQQPQPMTPVSQAVYATQGESIPAYTASVIPPTFPPTSYIPYRPEQIQNVALGFNRPHRRSDSSPVFHTEPLESAPAAGLKRRSTVKDQTSVQFDLTKEQADKERRADHLEQLKREAERANGVQLIDREYESTVRDDDRRSGRYEDRGYDDRRQEESSEDRYVKDSGKDKDSFSRVGAVAAGAIGAAAAATVLSGRSSVDEYSETSQRRRDERRQQRRAERRRGSEPDSTVSSRTKSGATQEANDHPPEERQPEPTKPPSPSRSPHKYDDYAEFFAPEELRYSPDTYKRRGPASMPTIVEIEPASERHSREALQQVEESHSGYRDLPWPVPVLKLIEPTPPQSLSGSVRDAASPVGNPRDLPPHEEEEDVKPAARQTSGSHVSWGEHETHEYEVPSTSSELESVDHETTRERQEAHSPVLEQRKVSSRSVTNDMGADIEFAAALAAATAAAGFDPALVTEDPTYHTRSSPPGSRGGVEYSPSWVESEFESRIPHGFVEGEVETPEDERAQPNRFVEEQPLCSEPEPVSREPDNQEPPEPQTRTSIAQEVIDRLDEKQDERDGSRKALSHAEKYPNFGKERDESDLPARDSFSMPGGFEIEESRSETKRDVDSRDDGELDRRSVASAPVSGECDSSTRSRKSTQDSGYFDDGEDAASASVEPDGSEGKKKRRKRRSKRDSDTFTDSASVTSSPARIGQSSEKRKSTDDKDKEKRTGGFFSSIFGSRVSEPVDSKRSSSADRPSSREVQSEVGRREYEESGRRRREERSLRRDEESGSDKENSKARDMDGIDIENYKSSRQRREERRRRRYEDIVDSGKSGEYEKDRKISEDNDENEFFLAEGPEMPVQIGGGDRECGASGRVPLAEGAVTGLGLGVLEQRPRGRSTPPEASEKIMDPAPRSRSRPASPEPNRQEEASQSQSSRRSSMLRSKDSPTAVPLHFRRPPISPGANRSVSVGAPTAPSPGSPTAPKRRPNSTEFKTSREIRPLWLVERHGPGHGEHEPEESLPSLPSSKTSSANASVEDLTVLQDERSWEAVDLSHHVHETRRPSGIDVSQSKGVEHDVLGSQQATPTAATFDQIHPHPPSRKEKLKYEFHSPSELLQDPSPYGDVQPFEMGDLPSAEGSAVGVKDASAENEDNVERRAEAVPSRPSTPQNNVIAVSEDTETTPTQTRTVNAFEGPGFAGVVDAAVAAAVSGHLSMQPDVAGFDKEGPVDLPGDVNRTDKSTADHEPAAASVSNPGAPLDFAAVVDAAVAAATGSTCEKPEVARKIEQPQATEESKDEIVAAVREQQGREEPHLQQSPEISEPVPQVPHGDEQETSRPTRNADSVPRDDKRRDSVDTVVPLAEDTSQEKEMLDASAVAPDATGENKELPSETTNENANNNDQATSEVPPVDTDEPSSSSAKKKKKKNKKKRQSMDSSTQEPTTPVDDSTVDQGEVGISLVEDARTDAAESSEPTLKEQFLAEQPASAEATAAPEQEPTEAAIAVEKATEAPDVSKALEEEPAPAAPEDTPAESTAEQPAEDQAETVSSKKSKKKKKKKNKGSAPEENTEDPTATEAQEPSPATSQVIAGDQVEPTVETTQPAEGEPKPTEERTIAVPENTVEAEPVPKEMEATEDPTFHDIPVPGELQGSPVEVDNQAKELPHSGEEFQAEPTRAQELPESTEITHKIDELSSGIDLSAQAGSDMVNETASPEVWHDALGSSPEDKSAETEQADIRSDRKRNEENAPESEIQPFDKEQAEIPEKPVEVDAPALGQDLPEEQHEQFKETSTPLFDSHSTDQVEAAESSVRNEEVTSTTAESETPLSRRNSKKNKKKNKRKNTAETSVQNEAVDTAEPISSVEGVPEPGPEPTTAAAEEPQLTLPDQAVQENKEEATDVQKDITEEPSPQKTAEVAHDSQPTTVEETQQTGADEPAPDAVAEIMSESQPAAAQDVLETAPEEPVDEQPKKKSKKKKNRKSVDVSESQPESEAEAKTEELRSVEAAETPQPQISGEVATVDSQVPSESSNTEAPAGIEEVASIPAAEEVELNLPVEKDEANGGEPHVSEPSEQPNIETVSGPEPGPEPVPEAGETAPSGKKSKKNKKKKQSLSLAPDETPASESLPPADAADGSADLPVAPEDSSLETDKEPMREEPTESQPTVDSVTEPPDQSMTDEAAPMTAAQKKKAKKEKKKKRQSALLDETPASESIEEADTKDVASEGAQMRQEVPSESQSSEPTLVAMELAEATTEHSQEQSKEDVSLHTERSSNSDGEFVMVPEHVSYGSNDENTPQSGSTGFDVTQLNSELEKQALTQDGVLDANEAIPTETPVAAAQLVQEKSTPTSALEGGATVEQPEAAEKGTPEDSSDNPIEHNEPADDNLATKEAQAEVVSTENQVTDQGGAGLDVEAGSEGLVEDNQSSASSKKKDKKKKKKRQSVALDDEQSPSTKEEVIPEPSSGRVPEPSAADESASTRSAPEEQQKSQTDATETGTETAAELASPFASEEPENIAEGPSNEATQEPAADETQTAESTEEAQTAKSKKKAKKDKKKRKSVSFEIEEPSSQQSEPGHPTANFGETVTQHEDSKPENEATAQKGLTEEFQPAETVPESLTQSGADIATQHEQPEPTAKATEVTEQDKQVTEPFQGSMTDEQPVVEGTAAPTLADEASQLQEQKVSSEALWSETQEDGVKSVQEAESLDEKKEEPAVRPSPEDNEGIEPEALAEQAESEPQTPIDDGEQGAGPSKSKKNKKKKKKNTLESTKDVPVIPPEPSDVEPLESIPVLETENAHDTVEPDTTVSETVHEDQTPQEESSGFMSAKAKKKAKKDKKRQSKILDSANDAASTAETTPDFSEQPPLATSGGEADGPDAMFSQETSEAVSTEAKSTEPSPETALTPAEDDGKENQSRDTEPHGGNDKDLTWTDHMVSSQVEQQQAAPFDRPSQPALEVEPTPIGEAATSIDDEQRENNADDASPAVDDGLERSGEGDTPVKSEIVAEDPEMPYEGLLEIPQEEKREISSQGEDAIQVKSDAQVEESVKETVEGPPEDSMSQERSPESVPDGGDAATKDQSTDIEVNDPSKSEDVLEPENEELPLSTSGKKKKKDKKKKKAQQETKTDEMLQEPLIDAVQEKSLTSHALTDTAVPVAESQAAPVTEPSHELSEPQKSVGTAVEDKDMEESLEVQQEVAPAEDGFEEAQTLSRKKSKKDKKRERLARRTAVESRENESKEEQLAIEEHLVPLSDAQPAGLAAPISTRAPEIEIPSETTADTGEGELHSSMVQSTVPVEDNINTIETSGSHTVESFQTLEAPEQPLEREILLNDDAATAPEGLPAAEKSVADAEIATEPIIEEAALSRKSSKKKAKKAKKQAQEQQEKNSTSAPAELGEDNIVEATPTIPSRPGPAENCGDVHEGELSEEQRTLFEHSEQLAPSDAARPQETFEQTPDVSNQTDDVLSMEQEKEGNFQAEPSQGLEIRNEQVADESIESQPEPTAAVARKLSKKEKRKAKKKSAKDAIEPADKPELQNPTDSIGASVSNTDQAKSDQDPVLTVASDKQMVEEEVPRSIEVEARDPEVHQGAADEDDWPAIDWEKGKVEIKEQTPLSSPEAHAVPFEPAIAEFDESAIPEGLLRRQSQSREEQVGGGNDGSAHYTGADETEAAPQEGGMMIEPSAVVETDQSAELKAEPVSSQVAPNTIQEKAVQHPENDLAWDQAKSATEGVPSKQSKVASIFPNLERGSFRRPVPGQGLMSVKDRAEDETINQNADGNSAIQVSEAPIPVSEPEESHLQGQQDEKSPEPTTTVSTRDLSLEEPTKMQDTGSTPVNFAVDVEVDPSYNVSVISDGPGNEAKSIEIEWKEDDATRTLEVGTPLYAPLPVHEQKSSLVSQTSPVEMDRDERIPRDDSSCGLRRSPSIHGRHNHTPRTWSLEDTPIAKAVTPPLATTTLFGGPAGAAADMGSPPRTPLQPIAEQEPEDRVEQASGFRSMVSEHGTPRLEMKPEHVLPRPETPIRKFTDNALARQAWPVANNDKLKSSEDEDSGLAVKKRRPGNEWPAEVLKTPDQGMPILRPSSVSSIKSVQSNHSVTGGQRSLRRTSRNTSGDLRAASQAQESHSPQPHATPQPPQPPPSDLNIERIASSSSYDPVTDKGKRPIRAMTDVYEGWGETPSSPRSPSRPPSIRHRRSMQHLQELESRLDQLISENRLLIAAREAAEDKLRNASVARRKSDHTLNERSADLRDREAEVENLKSSVEWLQKEVTRLTEENEGLAATNSNLTAAHAKEIESVRESSSRQLDDLRSRYEQLSMEVQNTVRHEIEAALARKDQELRRLREELETARDKVSQLQQQIAASLHDNVLVFRDEDYFDAACQKLCGHVQQWVLRFSKHSDHRRCRKLAEIQDEKIADRFDNAILDGYDTDTYLADRVRRRDVFMSVVMTMVWEFVFTRYLFGMDREQRQKLKSLEKQLSEVGPRSAVHRWRAITLTLLSKRPAFARQRESDTEAVALEIFETLSRLLPPPSHAEAQLLESLRKVLRVAVNLSIEMRAQLAEYIMLPPLQPEYDTNGDLARQVYFNASLMNERSGETTSNEELESQQAVVRVVLFPLVVKKGNDTGEGEDEVVVCPAQVLVARPDKDPRASKIFSSDRMSLDGTKSVHSVAPSSTMDISNVI